MCATDFRCRHAGVARCRRTASLFTGRIHYRRCCAAPKHRSAAAPQVRAPTHTHTLVHMSGVCGRTLAIRSARFGRRVAHMHRRTFNEPVDISILHVKSSVCERKRRTCGGPERACVYAKKRTHTHTRTNTAPRTVDAMHKSCERFISPPPQSPESSPLSPLSS